jgi:outer membrane protein
MRTLARSLAVAELLASAALLAPRAAHAEEAASAATPASSRVMTLAQAERNALEAQPQVLVARAATSVAQAQADQARSPYLPQVTANAGYTRETGNFVTRPGVTPSSSQLPLLCQGPMGAVPCSQLPQPTSPGWSLSNSYDYWNFGLTASQLIYDFGQTNGKVRAATATVEAQQLVERTARLQVIFGVRRAR